MDYNKYLKYKRKYLKSYYCNDGAWVTEWENSDNDYWRSCSGDDWDHWLHVGDWGGDWHTSETHLGNCTSNKSSAAGFNNLAD
jgi:hypothetical protein